MKRFGFIAWLLLYFSMPVSAQKSIILPDSNHQAALRQIESLYPTAQYGNWQLLHQTQSPIGTHWLWQQVFKDKPIGLSFVKLNISNAGKILSVAGNPQVIENSSINNTPADSLPVLAHLQQQQKKTTESLQYQLKPVWYWADNQLKNGYHVRFGTVSSAVEAAEILFSTEGKILDFQSLHLKKGTATPPDSLVTLAIFAPDPLSTAEQPYGTPYIDNNDADCTELNNQRVMKQARVLFQNDTFFLKSSYCAIKELDMPTKPVCRSLQPFFVFTRNNDCFEQVNAFYHINQYQQHLQNLGFNNLVNRQISVDANAMNGADQSMYSAFSDALYFGEGNVDDAEDADIICHEYTHAVSRDAAPSTNTGMERQTLEEANADVMAALYSQSFCNFNHGRVFNWDGNNVFWEGRSVSSNKLYTERVGNKYADAEIWSSAIMEISALIGREATEKNLLTSMFSYSAGMRMFTAARLFLQANDLLYNGADSSNIRRIYENRMILPKITSTQETSNLKQKIVLQNSVGFASGQNIYLLANSDLGKADLEIYSALGQKVWQNQWNTSESKRFCIETPPNWSSGIYFLFLKTPQGKTVWRLIR